MSVPLPTVPEDQEGGGESTVDASVAQAKHEAAEILARAHREAEAIVAQAQSAQAAPSPLAALGDNAEEIIGQVRKLIKKQRQLQDERKQMADEIEELKAERDELVQRLTDAVVRMEELSVQAQQETQPAPAAAAPPPPPQEPRSDVVDGPSPADPMDHVDEREETSLAARLGRAEREEDTSLAARLERAEREERGQSGEDSPSEPTETFTDADDDDAGAYAVAADGRSFYSRHSAKLPRLEGDGGRSVLSAVGGMRPDPEPKGRKSRRRKKG